MMLTLRQHGRLPQHLFSRGEVASSQGGREGEVAGRAGAWGSPCGDPCQQGRTVGPYRDYPVHPLLCTIGTIRY